MKKFNAHLFREMLYIIGMAAAAAFVVNLFHPRGYVMVGKSELEKMRIVPISAYEAKIKYDSGSAVFIDAREKEEFDESHIAGSINLPAGDPLPVPSRLPYLKKPKEIVIYCDGVSCGASARLAGKILGLTRKHIYIIKGGLPEWKERGFPVMEED
jgi:rhodanese-related sulfurtransferase